MATIPLGQKFHTTESPATGGPSTTNKGSAQANTLREAYTMQDIIDTVPAATGTITGSGTLDFLPVFTAAEAIGDSPFSVDGSNNLKIPSLVLNSTDTTTSMGFPTLSTFELRISGDLKLSSDATSITLYSDAGVERLTTTATGIKVTGQMDLAGLNTAPANAGATGTLGEIRWALDGANAYVYLCTAANTWVRAPLVTF